jgi:Transposase DDE domain group 1
LIAFTQRLALTGWARIAKPKRLRLRLFGVAGRVVRTGRRRVLKISATWPWAEHMISAYARLARLAST